MIAAQTREKEGIGTAILGAGGLLSRALPGYEAREPQVRMADLVERVLADGGQALVEAGTGVGKSFAYLVPAIYSGEKVVVSTDTIQLQQQLIGKDLPFLARVLGREVRFAIAKGRGNYLCERNAEVWVGENALLDPAAAGLGQEALQQFRAGKWDGDRATLKLPVADGVWPHLAGDDTCTGRRCRYAERCPALAARRAVEEADIIVANHHLYLLHHALTARGIGILPEHAYWIADEAHTLADRAMDVWGAEISQSRPGNVLKRVVTQAKALDVKLDEVSPERVRKAAEAFFDLFRGATKEEQPFSEYTPETLAAAEAGMRALVGELQPVRVALERAARGQTDPDQLRALQGLRRGVDQLIEDLQALFDPPRLPCRPCGGTGRNEDDEDCPRCDGEGSREDPDPPVLYAEVSIGRERDGRRWVTLHRKPAETRRLFQGVLSTLNAAVFASATLATGPGDGPSAFGLIADELGVNLAAAETLRAGSPFDYERQVRGYLPTTIPETRSPDYHSALAAEIRRVLDWTDGRAFVLFTSQRDLRAVRLELECRDLPWPLLVQGDAPKDLLVERFRQEAPAVLLGLRTFWTGVDIPGDALSCVIITKLPFPQPEHPLVKARCERIKARGGSDFRQFSLPRAIRDVLQGFGRLIRTRTDRGLYVILDPRMHTARYAGEIAAAHPPFKCDTELPTDWRLDDALEAQPPPGRFLAGNGARPDEEPEPGPDRRDLVPLGGVSRERDPLVAADDRGPGDLRLRCPPAPAAGGAAGKDPAAAGALLGRDAAGGVGGPEAAPEAPPGPGARHRHAAAEPGADGAGTAGPPRWQYLLALADAWYLDRGHGTGPVRGAVTPEEVREAQEHLRALATQARRVEERCAYLEAHPDDPDFAARAERTERSARRLGELGDALAAWAGVPPREVARLMEDLAATAQEREEREAA